tara:strand:+ start:71434 stop:72522 length:1089 start_codon:yes stop_codon:yes gene_type:complete
MKKIIILFIMILSTVSYSQTAITDSNFQQAINTCLSTNPVDGMCSDSEYGAMPDWDVSQVTHMSSAFSDRTDFNGDLNSWDVSNVIDMELMFFEAASFNKEIGNWDVGNVSKMGRMFYKSLFNQDISNWDVSQVTEMYGLFRESPFNQDISNWNVANVITMNSMFRESPFNQDISSWNVSKVENMGIMFHSSSFNQDISNWDVSNVHTLGSMFDNATSFNQDIGSWDVSNVTSMLRMFKDATSFNQNISSWCVTNIFTEPDEFSTNSSLIESNKPVWGTCPTASVDDQNQLDISIYPNPTLDIVYIDGNYSQLKVVVFDILGKQVINKSITNSIDISQLEKGVYILQFSDGAKLTTQRIIKN